ncbi:serpin family protein [Actinacidiphila acidipaludis]|uniref:Proteinase inhibitor I4 serpin n=1 Tax=Actinacidiphila acidipaludis TaxID=2873382 RepID=A0ABS7PZK4_9ACTN|nr:serpin family protein [Streptomyces acidipaludis]MBY8876168.1 proteinase inhibitor I4 serpin [Streptomyces acidipaludis]
MASHGTVEAVNAMTARWAATLTGEGTVLAGVGVWPLLGLLADGAAGPARHELAAALGVPADGAATAARELLSTLGAMRGLNAALGLWTGGTLPIEPAWLDRLPADVHGRLSGDAAGDQALLDAWAATCTDGQLDSMPVSVDGETLLVLASALTLRTDWIRPFTPVGMEAESGPWCGKELAGLFRSTRILDRVGVADTAAGPLTELQVLGAHGIDVHLYLGTPDATAGQVLAAAVDTLRERRAVVPGSRLPYGTPGPGVSVAGVPSLDGEPTLDVATVAFTVHAHHNLLDHPDLFGLRTAGDASRGHFPGVSAEPLAVQQAAQAMTATFGARGFRSAAVTAFSAVAGGIPRYPYRAREIGVRFDRPFGFLALHRTSRLVINAGWVTDPDTLDETSADW